MPSRTKLVGGTLGLVLLVLLAFLVSDFLRQLEERTVAPPGEGQLALLIARDEHQRAFELLKQVNKKDLDPDDRIQLLYQAAICARALGQPAEAYEHLEQLKNSIPELEDYRRFWMAGALAEMGELEAATEAYDDFILTSKNDDLTDTAHQQLASLHAAAKDYEQALLTYRRLLPRQPDKIPEWHYQMAQIHEERGDHTRARRLRMQLIKEHPTHHRALSTLPQLPRAKTPEEHHAWALVYFNHGQHKQAAKSFERFLKNHPRHQLAAEVRYKLGRAYQKDRQYDKALKAFNRAYEQHYYRSALYRMAEVLVRLNHEIKAVATFEKFSRLYPKHDLADDALWQAAKATERNNQFSRAEKFYQKLSAGYPDSKYRDEAWWSVGFTHYCRRQFGSALKVFREVSRMAREPHIVDQSLFWAGKAAEHLDREEESQAYFAEAAGGFPRSYYSTRATTLGFGKALTIESPRLQTSLQLDSLDSSSFKENGHLKRSRILQKLGLVHLAEGELQQAEKLNRSDIDTLKKIRDHYESLGALNRALRLSIIIAASDVGHSEYHHLYPHYYWRQVEEAARESRIDPHLVLSVIRQESYFSKDAVSRVGAIGLMQIMPQTGHELARQLGLNQFERTALFDPDISIRLGSRFLGDQVRQFATGPTRKLGFELGLAAYNAGPHVAHKWVQRFSYEDPDAFVERIPFKETRLYVKLVLKNYAIYKVLSEV